MEVRKGNKWYKVLKRFGNRILIEIPSTILFESKKIWMELGDYDEVK